MRSEYQGLRVVGAIWVLWNDRATLTSIYSVTMFLARTARAVEGSTLIDAGAADDRFQTEALGDPQLKRDHRVEVLIATR